MHDPSAAHCTQLARLQVFCPVPPRASASVASTPWAAAARASPAALTALLVDYARDGADRRWALAVATPPLGSVVGTAQGIVAVEPGSQGAWLSPPLPALAAVVCDDVSAAAGASVPPAPPVARGTGAGDAAAPPAVPVGAAAAPAPATPQRTQADVAAATKRCGDV